MWYAQYTPFVSVYARNAVKEADEIKEHTKIK